MSPQGYSLSKTADFALFTDAAATNMVYSFRTDGFRVDYSWVFGAVPNVVSVTQARHWHWPNTCFEVVGPVVF